MSSRRDFLIFTIKKLSNELPQLENDFVQGLEELLPMASDEYLESTYTHLKDLKETTIDGLEGVDMDQLEKDMEESSI